MTTKNKERINLEIYGKVPPQVMELEKAVLGAIMLEKNCFDQVSDILKPDSFYGNSHALVYKAMVSLAIKNMPIDLLTVVEQLKSTDELELVGGAYFLVQLTNIVTSTANIESHAKIIAQKFMGRELIRISSEVIQKAYNDTTDVFDLQNYADGEISGLINNSSKNINHISAGVVKVLTRIEELRKMENKMTGVPSNFTELDKCTNGWQDTDLIILAARPSVGKTAFAGNLASAAAKHFNKNKVKDVQNKSVAFFSLEMSAAQLIERLISCESEIWLEKIKNGDIEDNEMKMLYDKGEKIINEIPIFIDDTAALNIFELRSKCRRLKAKNNLGLIIIDYLQLMSGVDNNKGNREQEISRISRDLKGLAKELQVPIIALSQLSREVEKRKEGAKIPQLSDLRESGAIEQDADMVMFLYRPDYYDINANEMGESNKGQTFVKIAKHRNGDLKTIELLAKLHIQKFIDADGNNFKQFESNGSIFTPISDRNKKYESKRNITAEDESPF